jgi:hypothetical protein
MGRTYSTHVEPQISREDTTWTSMDNIKTDLKQQGKVANLCEHQSPNNLLDRDRQPRAVGRMWPLQPFYAARHMIRRLANVRRALRKTYIYIYI